MKKFLIFLVILPAFVINHATSMNPEVCRESVKIACDQESILQEDTIRTLLDRAEALRNQGKAEEAIDLYRKITTIQPDNSEAYIGWLTTCFGSDQEEEGIEVIDRWIEANPENTQAWLYKAFAEAGAKHPEKSLHAFEMLIQLQPGEPTNWIGKGQMLYELGRYDEALDAFDHFISTDTTRADVTGMKASTLAKLGRYDEAVSLINTVLEDSPDDATGIYNRACIYCLKGDKENALADLKRAIELEASFKEYARTDKDFKSIYEDEEFKSLTQK